MRYEKLISAPLMMSRSDTTEAIRIKSEEKIEIEREREKERENDT